jgi:hypothetical protein
MVAHQVIGTFVIIVTITAIVTEERSLVKNSPTEEIWLNLGCTREELTNLQLTLHILQEETRHHHYYQHRQVLRNNSLI